MRILLDESVPRRFGDLIVGHIVTTAIDRGWSGLKNGELLERAQSEFEVLVTVDRNLIHQHDLRRYSVLVVVLGAKTNRLRDLRPLIPSLLAVLERPQVSPVLLEADRT